MKWHPIFDDRILNATLLVVAQHKISREQEWQGNSPLAKAIHMQFNYWMQISISAKGEMHCYSSLQGDKTPNTLPKIIDSYH